MSDSPATKIRYASAASLSAIALTVATAEFFLHFGVPLHSSAEYGVVAGFWFVLSSGVLWLWKRMRQSQAQRGSPAGGNKG